MSTRRRALAATLALLAAAVAASRSRTPFSSAPLAPALAAANTTPQTVLPDLPPTAKPLPVTGSSSSEGDPKARSTARVDLLFTVNNFGFTDTCG
jgi:hypothetical protein